MGFPDRIERTVELAHPPAKVRATLTTAEGLGSWFGDEATINVRPGGSARMTWVGRYTVEMRVERVEEPTVFGFTWQLVELPEDDPRRTYVEFTLEPTGTGTRLRVVETGFAQLPQDTGRKTPAARRTAAILRAGRASWATWPATSMPSRAGSSRPAVTTRTQQGETDDKSQDRNT